PNVLNRYSPDQGASLKTYASLSFGNTIRDTLRQRQDANSRTDWGLLRKVSQKQLVEALEMEDYQRQPLPAIDWHGPVSKPAMHPQTLAPPAALQSDITLAIEVVAVQPRAAATEVATANPSLHDVIPPPPARSVGPAGRPPVTVPVSTPAIPAAALVQASSRLAAPSLPPAAEAAPASMALVDEPPQPQARAPLPESMPLATPNPQAENTAPAAVEIAVLAPTAPGLPSAQISQPQSPPNQPAARESASPSADSATALATARARCAKLDRGAQPRLRCRLAHPLAQRLFHSRSFRRR
ncbi:MAG: hypothetical protein HC929_24910, partial [Leptolyngbyaceae cyanobacterium SM2_5_2]|nr:hypothetical protein [Leptolyngbyaceae cyanobacterium SM2_5_2]